MLGACGGLRHRAVADRAQPSSGRPRLRARLAGTRNMRRNALSLLSSWCLSPGGGRPDRAGDVPDLGGHIPEAQAGDAHRQPHAVPSTAPEQKYVLRPSLSSKRKRSRPPHIGQGPCLPDNSARSSMPMTVRIDLRAPQSGEHPDVQTWLRPCRFSRAWFQRRGDPSARQSSSPGRRRRHSRMPRGQQKSIYSC